MQKYQSIISGTNGSVIRNVPVTVLKEDGSLAEIFMDREGQVQAPNPLATDSRGVFYFYAKNGRYSLRTAADGVQITDADTVLLFDPDETVIDGPIAGAVRRAEDAAERAETALSDSGLQTMVQNAQNAASNASQAVADANQAVASIDAALIAANQAKTDAQTAAQTASEAAIDAQVVKDSLLNYAGALPVTPEWSSVPAHVDSNLDTQAQALANRSELLRDNQKRTPLHFATYAEASAAAATLPDGQVVVSVGDEVTGVVSGGSISEEQSVYKVADYAKIRSYTGRGTRLRVIDPTGAHWWVRRGTGADNGGTILMDALGRRWEREYSGLVDVKWFGAIGDGVQDDTSAAQAAVYYAFAKGRQLGFKNGNFYITQIKLPQNSAEPVEPFYIIGENARILLKTTDVLFTTDGNFFYDLFVQNLVFVGEASGNFAAIDTKIFDCGKIMRLIVDSCASVYVNTVFHTPAGTYAQSVYAHKFIYRRGGTTGYFLNAPIAFDVSCIDCLVEQSYNGLRVVAPAASGNLQQVSRVTIRGGAWESLFGTAIAVGPCYQFTVDNVYFEGNGTDINLSYNATEADHLGVTITNNDFYQSPDDIAAGKFNVIWGINAKKTYRTGGNKTNGRLHDITGATGCFDFTGDFASLQLYNGMNIQNVRVGNSPVGRASFKTKEADWTFSGNDAVALMPSLGAIEMGRIGNADLVNGKVVRPRIAFGALNPQTNSAAYNNVEWCRGSVVHNSLPSELGTAGSKYVITGWVCVTSGFGGSDVWKEMRAATGA